jgi:hypothetical protein
LISECENSRNLSSELRQSAEFFLENVRPYANIRELDAAVLNSLIEKITVAEPEMVDGKKIQKITIYYKFIGNID